MSYHDRNRDPRDRNRDPRDRNRDPRNSQYHDRRPRSPELLMEPRSHGAYAPGFEPVYQKETDSPLAAAPKHQSRVGRSRSPHRGNGRAARSRSPRGHSPPRRMNSDRFRVEAAGSPTAANNDRPNPQPEAAPKETVTDPHRLAQRQKQVDYGKNTIGYDNYVRRIPKQRRRFGKDPFTPDITDNCSKRAFDGRIKVWRKQLHQYDDPASSGTRKPEALKETNVSSSKQSEREDAAMEEEAPPKLAEDIDQLLAGLKEDDAGDIDGEDLQAMTNKLLEELSDDSGDEGQGTVQSIYQS